MSMGLFKGIKQPGPGVEHSSFSSAEDKKRVEYSFSGPSWPEIGRTALLPLICSNSPRIRLSLSLSHTHTHTTALLDKFRHMLVFPDGRVLGIRNEMFNEMCMLSLLLFRGYRFLHWLHKKTQF